MSQIRHEPIAPTRAQWLASGTGIDAHRHDDHQLVYADRGVLVVTTSAGSWIAPASRAIWVPAGTVHAHQAHGGLGLHLVGLPVEENPLGLDEPAVLAVSPLLRELIRAYTGTPGDESPQRGRLRAVLLDQLSAAAQEIEQQPGRSERSEQSDQQEHSGQPDRSRMPLHLPAPAAPRLREVCEILRADPADNRTLAALGRQVGASDRTLSRLFKAELGMTFPQWRTRLRLCRALILLAEGAPVTAVAHRCGWSSASAFIDVFRRTLGYTPGVHRGSVNVRAR
jgi:AraC-like DNA-binding protein